jgi:hypothetical protein
MVVVLAMQSDKQVELAALAGKIAGLRTILEMEAE